MAMSQKDYELIARTIADQVTTSTHRYATLRDVTSKLSKAFMADNPRFDPDRFTRACGF